jgi:hypothetical protein
MSSAQMQNPVEHMNYLAEREEALSKSYISYMSEVAHGERARKMEKRRQDLINAIRIAIKDGNRLRPFKGDATLRDAYVAYWNILLSIFNDDYHKIVDMEEIAEQSYDLMEVYLIAQEQVNDKLDAAYEKVPDAYNAFAATHNVKLIGAQKTKLAKKLGQVGAVNAYSNHIYLIFFKASIQEDNLLKALTEKNVNAVEQSRNSLLKYANEGLVNLDTIKPYKGDGSLITATRKVLEFYKLEASKNILIQTDYLMKNEEFIKIKKSFDNKTSKTQDDVDSYNLAVNETNKALLAYNKSCEDTNNARTKALNNWNITKKNFMDNHIPYK